MMTYTKEDAARRAKENWQLAREWDREGDAEKAAAARQRAIEAEKDRDSWLYRTFGWLAMTAPPRTLQERLRNFKCSISLADRMAAEALMREFADALDAQSKLLAEAGETLEPFATMAATYDDRPQTGVPCEDQSLPDEMDVQEHWKHPLLANMGNRRLRLGDLRNARAVLAKLKAASVEP